ncbi:MAG TPA: extradiol ring-cleavage dioxygenase, partial [Clostridiales bacterium]|nr:extradiol ring-cleavage dioxygenase [Clostridiales bacterium]
MSVVAAFAVPHPPLILPEVGRGEEKTIQKTIDGLDRIGREIAELKPETVVLSSPHALLYADYFHIPESTEYRDNMRRFGAGGLSIAARCDGEFVGALCGIAAE